MSKPDPPAAPDPANTIAAQSTANQASAQQMAELNRITQNTPYGSVSYQVTGYYPDGTPIYTQNQTLSPAQQNLLNMQQQGSQTLGQTGLGMLGNVQSTMGQGMNTGNLPGIASGTGNNGPITTGFQNQGPGLQGQLNTSGLNPIQSQVNGGQTWQQAVQQAQNAAYYGQTQYLDPQFAQSHEALDNQLANQGITRGSQAYQTAQDNLARQQQQAYQSAAMGAVGQGNQEQNVLFGQGLSAADLANAANQQGFGQALSAGGFQNAANAQGFGQGMAQAGFANDAQQQAYAQAMGNAGLQNQANQQQLQQNAYLYNQPLNTYNALMTGAQVQQPQFTGYAQPNVATTDVGGITNSAYQNQMAQYNASMQGINNLFSLGGTLGSAAIMASDRRLKRDIKRIGTSPGGLPVYTFRYNADPEQTYVGVMADEVRPIFPDAVLENDEGYLMVDYGRIF